MEAHDWPETSTCLELGGCDENGSPVFNDLTRLFIEVHAGLDLLNPKLNCRFSAESDGEYLDLLSRHILRGHNVFALQNDDVLIPACIRAGKSEREARLYVNGGCQETVVEGVEHSAGAYYYFNMPRVLDVCLQPAPELPEEYSHLAAHVPGVIVSAASFEDFYQQFFSALAAAIAAGARFRCEMGRHWPRINPCPLFSSAIKGCLENAQDYTSGSAAYNPSGVCLVGLGTLIDSLHAIDAAVFRQKWLSLDELREALRNNWQGCEPLRARLQSLPKYGHGCEEVDRLAARFCRELATLVRTLPNERGEFFQPSFFVYYVFSGFGAATRATPDGRRNGDLLTQGVGPSHATPADSLTDVVHSLSRIDFADYPGNAVLDVQLPLGDHVEPAVFSAFLRSYAEMRGPTLQPNVVSTDDLIDAQVHPERHQGLTVRMCGLSVRFVLIGRGIQDEIISRAMYAV